MENVFIWPKNGATIRVLSTEPEMVSVFDRKTCRDTMCPGILAEVEQGCLRKKGLLNLNFLFATEILSRNSNGETVKHHFPSEEAALKELKNCVLKYHMGFNSHGRSWRFFSIEEGIYTLLA